jgi:filamentous hemagglutinin
MGGGPRAGRPGVKELEVGLYGELNKRAQRGDQLSHDHIPSFGAVKAREEATLGRKLTSAEERELRNRTVAIVIRQTLHAESRTFAGRNTQQQIQQDAKDLARASGQDMQRLIENAQRAGLSPEDVRLAIERIGEMNRQRDKK